LNSSLFIYSSTLISAASEPNHTTVAATGEQIQARGPHRVPAAAAPDVAPIFAVPFVNILPPAFVAIFPPIIPIIFIGAVEPNISFNLTFVL